MTHSEPALLGISFSILSSKSRFLLYPQPRTHSVESITPPDRCPPLRQTLHSHTRPHQSLQIFLPRPPNLPNSLSHPPRLLRPLPAPRPRPALRRLRLRPVPDLHPPPNRHPLSPRLGNSRPHISQRELGFHILVWPKRSLARCRR